jgi:hypothetical protein
MKRLKYHIVARATYAVIALAMMAAAQAAENDQIARGEYLVVVATCGDCHTPGAFDGHPDLARVLSGSDVAFDTGGFGAFVGGNITPDRKTGIGKWTIEDIVKFLRTGVLPDGSPLPPIHSQSYGSLSEEDCKAIAVYLKNIPAVEHQVPGPFKHGEKVTVPLIRKLDPGETAQ